MCIMKKKMTHLKLNSQSSKENTVEQTRYIMCTFSTARERTMTIKTTKFHKNANIEGIQ